MPRFIGGKPLPRQGAYMIDGERFVRVSTVLGVLAKPGLEKWKHDVGIAEANRISSEAAARGTAVHKVCEDVDNGIMTRCPDDLRPFLTAYLDWKARNVQSVEMVERTVAHRQRKYAGTLDRLFLLKDGRRVLADMKTGKSVDGVYRLQQIAYVEALEAEGEDVDGRLILHMPSSRPGLLTVIEYDDELGDRKAWRALLHLYRWNLRHQNDWKATR